MQLLPDAPDSLDVLAIGLRQNPGDEPTALAIVRDPNHEESLGYAGSAQSCHPY
jgi:hypothetical protein